MTTVHGTPWAVEGVVTSTVLEVIRVNGRWCQILVLAGVVVVKMMTVVRVMWCHPGMVSHVAFADRHFYT